MQKTIAFVDWLINKGLMLVSLIVFLVGCYFVLDIQYVYDHAAAGGIAARRQERAVSEVMQELSDEAVAWLTLDDTGIDYPVMQTDNNTKYLNVDPYGNYSLSGSIFLDFRNSSDFSDGYSIVYGHHMSNDYMFGALDRYEEVGYFNANRTGTLTIDNAEHKLNVFAFGIMEATEEIVFSPDDENNVRDYIKNHALIYRAPGDGNIIMLSTCRDPGEATRTLVFVEMLD